MKVLIIAGPYEADRLRRAAVSAGFETVAVEPGESLSGWITATRPDLIVMAPKIVNPDPAVALAKVRTVPRGRVPIFLVGDAADEARFKGLADGFFVRPVASADLMAEARLLLGTSIVGGAGGGEAADAAEADAAGAPTAAGGEGIPQRAGGADTGSDGFKDRGSGSGSTPKSGSHAAPKSGPHTLKNPPNLKPLVAEGDLASGRSSSPSSSSSPSASSGSGPHVSPALMNLDESIDATLEAEIREAIRGMGPRDRTGTPVGRPQHATAGAGAPSGNAGTPDDDAAGANPALEELRDESSQKTLEVPREVVARMASADSDAASSQARAAGHNGTSRARGPLVLAPAQQGDLGEEDLPQLLGRIYVERLTGWLTLKREGVEKAIVFERGGPILAGSNLAEDRMGEMLVRQGRLSAEQRAKSVEMLLSTGRRLGTVLVEAGYIKAGDLAPLVRRHFEEIIYSLFAWETGTWALTPDRPEKEETVLLSQHPVALIVEGIRRKYSAARLRARLGGGQAVPVVIKETGLSALLEQMALTDQERALVAWFDGVRTMDEIAARSGADDTTLFGVARALLVLRRVELVATAAEAAAIDSSDAAATLTPDGRERARAADHERERDREIDRARILARHALVRDGDYFQILGVSRGASPHEIRRAHQALVREFSAPGVAPDLQADLAAEIEAIRAVLDEGARVLGDARLRQRYQINLPPPAERSPA